MTKLQIREQMPEFVFDTPFETEITFSDRTKGKKTALVFLRYYGCPLCQYDMAQYAAHYEKIKAAGGQLFIVLQSDPDKLLKELGGEHTFPFEIICDKDQKLYHRFEIKPAKNQIGMAGPKTLLKLAKVKAEGFSHGDYEGEELQLPAAFVQDEEGIIQYAHYAKTVDDLPDAAEIAEIMNRNNE